MNQPAMATAFQLSDVHHAMAIGLADGD